MFNATYHTLTYLHLHAVDACYTPTHYQLSTAPKEMHHKFKVIFDGIDCEFFQPRTVARPTEFRGIKIEPDTRVVTYVSRGLESIRGFDIFMKAAKKIAQEVPNVLFLIAGDERTNYGHEAHHIGKQTFKQWVLNQDQFDLSKFHFLGMIPPLDLAMLFNLSDLHFYLTVPYVLSWSMMQAMASGCVILGSATAPVQEVIEDGKQGLLADFYDVDGLAEQAVRGAARPRRPSAAARRRPGAHPGALREKALHRSGGEALRESRPARRGRLLRRTRSKLIDLTNEPGGLSQQSLPAWTSPQARLRHANCRRGGNHEINTSPRKQR